MENIETKICSNPNCPHGGKPQPLSNFHKRSGRKCGVVSRCKDCVRMAREKNKEEINAKNRKYYAEHAKEHSDWGKAYYQLHKEEILKNQKKRYEENKDQIKKQRKKFEEENKEWIKERNKKKHQRLKAKDPAKFIAYSANRRARKKELYPEDADFKEIEKFYQEAKRLTEVTGIPHEVDHIIPLSRGGLHHQDNLQILTRRENRMKHDKTQEEFEEYKNKILLED